MPVTGPLKSVRSGPHCGPLQTSHLLSFSFAFNAVFSTAIWVDMTWHWWTTCPTLTGALIRCRAPDQPCWARWKWQFLRESLWLPLVLLREPAAIVEQTRRLMFQQIMNAVMLQHPPSPSRAHRQVGEADCRSLHWWCPWLKTSCLAPLVL